MATKAQLEVPAGMQRLCRRFELWRRSHRGRLPIPERLWASAAAVAREHGVFRTAKVLRLEYGKLKRMAEAAHRGPQPTTPAAFLELMPQGFGAPERTGVFTSGLVWIVPKRRIALYFTGCKHAGENLAEVLKLRSADLPPIIQMCDALSRNAPKIVETLVANLMRTAGEIL